MKNFKKLLAVMTAAIVMVGCLAGCGSGADADTAPETQETETGDAADPAQALTCSV